MTTKEERPASRWEIESLSEKSHRVRWYDGLEAVVTGAWTDAFDVASSRADLERLRNAASQFICAELMYDEAIAACDKATRRMMAAANLVEDLRTRAAQEDEQERREK